jgi:ATP-binding cassette, subfamily B, bacterial
MIAVSAHSGNRSPLARRLRKLEAAFLHPFRWKIAVALAAMLLQSLLLLPIPWLQGLVIDRLISNPAGVGRETRESLALLIILTTAASIGCLAGRVGLSWLSGGLMNHVSLQFVRSLTDSLHRKLQRLPLAYFDGQETGQLMARLTNDVGTLLIFLSASSLQLIADLVLAVGIAGGLLCISWPLALISFLALPVFFWNNRRFAFRIWSLSHDVQEKTASLYALLSERISAIRAVRAFGAQQRELAEFESRLNDQTAQSRATLSTSAFQNFSAAAISGLATALLVCLAALLVQRQAVTTGQAVVFVAYLGMLYQPLVRLSHFCGGIAATLAAVDRITEVLDEAEPHISRLRHSVSRVRGELRMRNVSFRYQGDQPNVLEDINLHVEPGMTVGVWGTSGSGKSTLLSLLPRLYELRENHGEILLDGRDTRSLPSAYLRRHVLLVPQQARLFEGTIRYNLTYAAPGHDEALIRRVLSTVDLQDYIDSLSQGIETWVGERGVSLSGGQRQRLALARGLLCKPPVLLLDDCTSALDARTEALVLRQIAKFRPQQTRLIVSHKLESLVAADWLIVMEHGRIVSQGPPPEVVKYLPGLAPAPPTNLARALA